MKADFGELSRAVKDSGILRTIPLLIAVCLISMPAYAKYGGGSGTAGDPYQIATAGQLNAIGAEPNDWDKHFVLMADIDLQGLRGAPFNMIGVNDPYGRPFSGVFNGNDKTISNLTCNKVGATRWGLFAAVQGTNALVKNLRLNGAVVNAGTAGIAGTLVGYLHSGRISRCHADGGSVSGTFAVGGLVGICSGTVINCSSSASISTSDGSGGGLAGQNTGTVAKCCSTGQVSARSFGGGVVGENSGTVSDCYSTAMATATKGYAGGLVATNSGNIRNCYSAGAVLAPQGAGGLVGGTKGQQGVTDSLWDVQTSGQSTSAGGSGKNTVQMKAAATFAGWDFVTTWTIQESVDYPRLQWEADPFPTPVATTIEKVSGDNQYARVGSKAALPLTVCVKDQDGEGMIDAPVEFIVTAGEGTVEPVSILTTPGGFASAVLTLGPTPGPTQVRATVGNLLADFNIEAKPLPVATTIEKVSGDGQCALAGRKLASPLTVCVKDQDDAGMASVQVEFAATEGGGTVEPVSAVTNANGLASTTLTLGPAPGTNVVKAVAASLSASFEASGLARGYGGGTGESDDPYLIYTAEQLYVLGTEPNDWDKHFKLMADIDLDPNLPDGQVFDKAIIAPETNDLANGFQGTAFTGVFDGNDHTISHLTLTGGHYLGLFGQLGSRAELKDLGVVDVKITGSGAYISGLVGFNYGTVIQCYSTGTVIGTVAEYEYAYVGGLVGSNYGTVTQCYSTCAVSGAGQTMQNIGGLVGFNQGSIATSYSTGSVSGRAGVGGLVGFNYGTVTQCYSTGAVSGKYFAGGLVGNNYGSIATSFWDIQTSGQTTSAGGTGKTTAEMQMASTFLAWGACGPLWTIREGQDYPHLAWENEPGQVVTGPTYYGGGTGTPADPYLIHTADQLNTIGLVVCDRDKHFKLMADIDLSGFDGKDGRPAFNIVGQDTNLAVSRFQGTGFSGVLDGNGHTVSHLTVTGGSYLGLFGKLESGAVVRNLGLVDVKVAGSGDYVGGLVGFNGGVVSQCYSTGAINGVLYVGGLVGWNAGPVTYCYSTAQVTGAWGVGGLVGENYATVTRCYSAGKVSGTHQYIGGLIGYGRRVVNCFWDTQTSGQATSAGGTGKTTAEMQTADTFFEWAICNEGVWAIDDGKDYPRLTWEHKPGQVLDIRLSDFLAGTGTEDAPYLIQTAEDVATIAKFPCEKNKHFRLAFLTGEGTPEMPYLIETAGQIDLLNLCPYERDAHFRLGFLAGEGSPESPYLIETAEQIDMLNLCPYERDAHFRLGFITGEGTENNPYLICTAEQINLLRMCPYERDANFRLGFVTGEGTQDSPYLIYTADELNLVGMCPYERDGHFRVMADIDLSSFDGKDGRPAFNIVGGGYLPFRGAEPFTGVFDGNGHTIWNFSYACTEGYSIGLFGCVSGPNSVVENLKLAWPNIDVGTGGSAGALVGYLEGGTIANCHIDGGTISGGYEVGGLVGTSYQGTITDCNSTATVWANSSVGGLVGYNQGAITHCDSGGHVLGDYNVGGLVGITGFFDCDRGGCWDEPGTIYDCYSTAAVLGTGSSCGGLVGSNDAGDIARCYASGIVLGVNTVGGLIGWNQDEISSCYSTADVGGEKDVGGLVGLNSGGWPLQEATVANCYSTGIVLGGEHVGGLVGMNEYGAVVQCYSTSAVGGSQTSAGGLVGSGDANDVVASFWDTETSGQAATAGCTGKTTAEMQTGSTFLNAGLPAGAGWDFVGEMENGTQDIWAICEGVDYPHLAWEFVIGDFDADADTDFVDFCILAEHWLAADGSFWCGQGCDLTNDGSVNWQDLMIFADNWLGGFAYGSASGLQDR